LALVKEVHLVRKYFIFLVSRIIKIVANLTKSCCYIFHFMFPKKRFVLPKHALPLLKNKRKSVIPNTIWQTNYTNRVTIAVYLNYLFNRLLSPTWEYRFMITEDRGAFIKNNYSSDIYENYMKLQIGAAQADFWRLLVLHKHGGVYLDIDAHFVWPLNSIIRPEYAELYLTTKRGDLSNYFIGSKSNNDHLLKLIDAVLNNIKENKLDNVYELTGPGVFNQVLDKTKVNTSSYRYTCNQGNFTNEFFQYIDKSQGKWTHAQKKIDIVKKAG